MHFAMLKTRGGYLCGEVRSALQKELRRGNEREALFWVTELDLAGYGAYAFRTLRLIASEDVGLAEPQLPATIKALHETFLEVRKEEKKAGGQPPERSAGMTYLVHAALLVARARKSRIVDNACIAMYHGDRQAMAMEIPDYAVDHHTARGRRLGRTEQSSYGSSYRIEGWRLPDPYLEEALAIDGIAAERVPELVAELMPPAPSQPEEARR